LCEGVANTQGEKGEQGILRRRSLDIPRKVTTKRKQLQFRGKQQAGYT